MNADDTIDTLNELIEISRDGEYGFRSCAEQAEDPQLKQVLAKRADECAQAVKELQHEVVTLGGDAEDRGTAAGAVHRGWVSIKSRLSGYRDRELLEEVERGEDKALKRYTQAAGEDLTATARMVVLRQLEGVRRNHEQMRALRDAARAEGPA